MKQIDGLWWPDFDVRCRQAVVTECAAAMPVVLPLVKERRVCVQAGGNVGVYPLALAKVFDRVITFEPDEDNWLCLRKNVTLPNVMIFECALGSEPGMCGVLRIDTDNCGSHKTLPGTAIPVRTIDSLGLDQCDLIWLDIEGAEADAIKGAMATIEKFSPIIVLEEKGLGPKADLPGYSRKMRIGNDTVYWRT
jgi:FkbM family methyltransferase